jgi:hypothetical protein
MFRTHDFFPLVLLKNGRYGVFGFDWFATLSTSSLRIEELLPTHVGGIENPRPTDRCWFLHSAAESAESKYYHVEDRKTQRSLKYSKVSNHIFGILFLGSGGMLVQLKGRSC